MIIAYNYTVEESLVNSKTRTAHMLPLLSNPFLIVGLLQGDPKKISQYQ